MMSVDALVEAHRAILAILMYIEQVSPTVEFNVFKTLLQVSWWCYLNLDEKFMNIPHRGSTKLSKQSVILVIKGTNHDCNIA
jgi:hypothetical protein